MTLIALTIALAMAGVAGAALVVAHGRNSLKPRKRVVISTLTGYGAAGVLHRRSHRTVTLRDARVTTDINERPPVPVDGELVIDRDQILWIQVTS